MNKSIKGTTEFGEHKTRDDWARRDQRGQSPGRSIEDVILRLSDLGPKDAIQAGSYGLRDSNSVHRSLNNDLPRTPCT